MDDDEFACLDKLQTLSVNEALMSCSAANSNYESIIAFVLKTGDLFLYALRYSKLKPIVRWIPWIDNVEKRLAAICFNPIEGEAILAVCSDGSLYVIQSLALLNGVPNDDTSEDGCPNNCQDIISLPSPILGGSEGKPVAVIWWVRGSTRDSTKHTAVVGFTNGLMVAFAIYTGIIVFETKIEGCVCRMDVCSRPGRSHILVTNDLGKQWRVILRETEEDHRFSPSSFKQNKNKSVDNVTGPSGSWTWKGLESDSEPSTASGITQASNMKEGQELITIPCKKEFKLNIFLEKLCGSTYGFSFNSVVSSLHGTNLVRVNKIGKDRKKSAFETVHALPHRYSHLVITNSFLVFANDKMTTITVISQRCSNVDDSKREGLNKEFNGESFVQEFCFAEGERIKNLFCTDSEKEMCSVVTNYGIYCLRLKKLPRDLVLHDILSKNLSLAEKHCNIFGLDIHKLVCEVGGVMLRNSAFEEAKSLFALSRNGNTYYVAELAAAERFEELLHALQSYKFTNTNKCLLTTMKILVFVHQYVTNFTPALKNEFSEFLAKGDYDEYCAISFTTKAGLCDQAKLIMKNKGLQQPVLIYLSKTVAQQEKSVDFMICKEFWELISDETLAEPLLTQPNLVVFYTDLVKQNLHFFDKSLLVKFEILYNPLARTVRNFIEHDYRQATPSPNAMVKIWLETYLLICVQLSSMSKEFNGENLGLFKELDFHEVVSKKPIVPQNISVGFKHAYFLRHGIAYGWGYSSFGCLGLGPKSLENPDPKPLETLISLKKQVLSISCGKNHSIALTNDGVYSWGSNKYGQLGIDGIMQSWYPVAVRGLFDYNIVHICAGQYHSLALDDEDRVFSWGWGVHGQLGHGDVEDVFEPKIISTLNGKNITSFAAGQMHSVFLDTSGRVWTCGSNAFGQLGIGDVKKSTVPVPLYCFTESVALISGGHFQNCAVSTDGKVYQWGTSPSALRSAAQLAKQRLKTEENIKDHAFVLKKHSEYLIPKLVDTLSVVGKIVKVAVGCEHCIILTDVGGLYAWGRNDDGQLGISGLASDGHREQYVSVPTCIKKIDNVVDIACGWEYSVAINRSSSLYDWGKTIHAKANRTSFQDLIGGIVTINNKNRVIKLPHSTNNTLTEPSILLDGFLAEIKLSTHPLVHRVVDLPSVLKPNDWRCRMHFALEKWVNLYNPSLILERCISIGEHDACSKLALIRGDFKTATLEKLISAESENDQETVLKFFLPEAIGNPSQLSPVLESIITYWLERDLSAACFEKVCSSYLDQLTKPLGNLVFGVNSEVKNMSTKLSTEFKLRLVKNMFQFDKKNVMCVMNDFTDFGSAIIALDNSGDFIDISADQISKLCSEAKQKLLVRLN